MLTDDEINRLRDQKFLNLDRSAWARMVIGWIVGIVLAFGLWWYAVQSGLAARPLKTEVIDYHDKDVKREVNRHNFEAHSHPDTREVVSRHAAKLENVLTNQAVMQSTLKNQTKVLENINQKLNRIERKTKR